MHLAIRIRFFSYEKFFLCKKYIMHLLSQGRFHVVSSTANENLNRLMNNHFLSLAFVDKILFTQKFRSVIINEEDIEYIQREWEEMLLYKIGKRMLLVQMINLSKEKMGGTMFLNYLYNNKSDKYFCDPFNSNLT